MRPINPTATRLLALLVVALCCAGCLKSTHDYAINPDGSGKVTVEESLPNMAAMFGAEDGKKTSKEDLRKFVARVIGESTGIELWKDVSYKILPDGRLYFKGTAYFHDYNGVHFAELANEDLKLDRNADGSMTFALSEKTSGDSAMAPPRTEEEMRHASDSLRKSFDEARQFLSAVSDIYEHATFRFAGTVRSSRGFRREGDGVLGVEIEGKRLMSTIDSVTALPGFWDDAASGDPSKASDARIMAALFGGLPRADILPASAPLFDYRKEVEAGGKEYASLRKKIGVQ